MSSTSPPPPSSATSPSSSSDSPLDPTPFLSAPSTPTPTPPSPSPARSLRRQSLREAARFLRRASSRHRNMREPSVTVRETAAEQLEERQSDWAYSKPVVVLDMIWNLAFVVVTSVVLWISRKESPSVPLRVWVVGYGVQCLIHMVCVFVEFRKRRRGRGRTEEEERERLVDGEEEETEEDGRSSRYMIT